MQSLQRALSLVAGILLVLMLPFLALRDRALEQQKAWREAVLLRFFTELSKKGNCDERMYLNCAESLARSGTEYELRILEYIKTEGAEVCWTLITWDEIKESLFNDGNYSFSKDSIVELRVVSVGKQKAELFYSGRIGEESG